ncbi:TPA: tail fiber assembly protein [Klebsiella pneumoniae]
MTVYDIQTLASHVITEPGPIPDTVTTSAPSTPYDKWDGSAWVTDADAQHTADIAAADLQKKKMITQVSDDISILQDAVALNMATDEEKSRLTSLQAFRVLLNRVDTSLVPNIVWPVMTTLEDGNV